MFPAAVPVIAKIRKQPRCLPIQGWIKNRWCICTMEYYSAIKRNEILPFGTWMDLESIMLSEICQTEKDKCPMISLICGIEINKNK